MIGQVVLSHSGYGSLDRFLRWLVPLALIFLLAGCSSVSYYQQLAAGQWQLLRARQPVASVIADPQQPQKLREHLRQVQAARNFASQRLHLPDNGSYRTYADIGRPYVVWNVFATPALSLSPRTQCFPIAGCVAYRGYYHQSAARGAAALLRLDGLDVHVGGVQAYSTLGWFDDPILSSMVGADEQRLASVIFHELAHQRFYIQDDTPFNESFATLVEQQGSREWRTAQGLPPADPQVERQRGQFIALVLDTRERLQALYRQPLAPAPMLQRKAAEFERLRQRYAQMRDEQWHGDRRYDAWVYSPLNNAKLLPFGLYDQWVPAFATLFTQAGGDWPLFYRQVERLGRLPPQARGQTLRALMAP